MKLAKPILLSTAIAGILASPAAAALSATATTELNLRSGPGPEYQIEGVIPGDAEVEVTGCLEEAEWCEVTHEGVSGWAYSAYLTTPVEDEPVVLYQRPAEVQIDTVTYDKTEGQGVAAGLGAGWGAAIGSLAIGGPAAILAQNHIKKVEVLDFPELGMEAVWKIEVRDFPAFIVVDDKGNDFFEQVRAEAATRDVGVSIRP